MAALMSARAAISRSTASVWPFSDSTRGGVAPSCQAGEETPGDAIRVSRAEARQGPTAQGRARAQRNGTRGCGTRRGVGSAASEKERKRVGERNRKGEVCVRARQEDEGKIAMGMGRGSAMDRG